MYLQFSDTHVHALSKTISLVTFRLDHWSRTATSRPDQTRSFQTFVQTILLTYWPPNQTKYSQSDHQTKPMSVCQTNRPDQTTFPQSTNQLDIFTARPASRQTADEPLFIQVRSIHYGLGQGRLIHKALVGPCKAYYPQTFGLKSLDFYFRL